MKNLKFYLILTLALLQLKMYSQAGFEDDRVMLQGFYWESCTDEGDQKWYNFVLEKADEIKEARFDLIWLPPPSFAGDSAEGYAPKEYYNFNNSYGNEEQHKALLNKLWENGIEPIADIVINHRDGSKGWADFENPKWGLDAIVHEDEVFDRGPEKLQKRINETMYWEEFVSYDSKCEWGKCTGRCNTYQYDSYRDISHKNPLVRKDIIKYLNLLKEIGYRGWRYDMVHGYHAQWIALYNKETNPTFSVGEYDWGSHNETRGWMWHSATNADNLKTASSAFDFTTFNSLKECIKGKKYTDLAGFGKGLGLIGDTTDGQAWKNRSVTFAENHDTGYRKHYAEFKETDEEYYAKHKFDTFQKGREIEQAYAYILTHPGVPCVFWKHYFQWTDKGLPGAIKTLINARKVAKIHSGSRLDIQSNAIENGVYAAKIVGKNENLFVRIGGDDSNWNPKYSYPEKQFKKYAEGEKWKVWIEQNEDEVKQASLNLQLEKTSGYLGQK